MASRKAVLNPIERVSEIVFGVLMAITFTGSVSVAADGSAEVRTMLFAAFGCNLAWGLADAAMYLVSTLTERARATALLLRLRAEADPAEARSLLARALPDLARQLVGPDELEAMRRRLHALPGLPEQARLNSDDYAGAAGVFALVVLATIPLAVPFVIFSNPAFAIRASNLAAIVTLFLGGWYLGRYAGGRPWLGGFTLTAVGVALVTAIVALGG